MPRYEFKCDCGKVKDIIRPIAEGPPDIMICECGKEMGRVFSCEFILRGGGWAGKELRAEKAGYTHEDAETMERKRDENRAAQETQDEVLAERRKGKEHYKRYKKNNQSKIEKYRKNLQKGIRGK